MDKEFTFSVDEESHGQRLDKFLATELLDQYSRERLQGLIKNSQVSVNGKTINKPAMSLREGDTIRCQIPEAAPLELQAEALPLEVVFEDAHMLVINKPVGMLTHPTGREQRGTLVNALLAYCGDQLSGINGVIRPGIVHRLDRDTSGLLMVAKTNQAHQHLSAQLKAKTARREYVAIVQGSLEKRSGTVDAPIGRSPRHRDQMAVTPEGRPAVTHWTVLEQLSPKFSLIRLALETGRTHQIRVHMAHIGHPLLGDPLYGTGLAKQMKLERQLGLKNQPLGQLLQAVTLGFTHPVTQEPMRFEIPVSNLLSLTWDYLKSQT